MGEGKKIIDLRHGRSDDNPAAQEVVPDMEAPVLPARAAEEDPADSHVPWADEDDVPVTDGAIGRWGWTAIALGTVWTVGYVWASLPLWLAMMTPELATQAVAQWAMPLVLIGVLYLAIQRNSTSEARRFARVAGSLRAESAMLESLLSQVNAELSLAREFLSNQSLELESLGRVSSDRLRSYAEELRTTIEASDTGMRAIGEVSAAACGNMEKLRNHLPVIASSAKDVTNQIGNAGRTAQGQVEGMIGAFQRLNSFGQAASAQIATLLQESEAATQKLTQSVETSGAALSHQVAEASQQMDQAIETVASRLANARNNLDQTAEAQADQLLARIDELKQALAGMAASMAEQAASSRSEVRAAADDLGLTLTTLATSANESEATIRQIISAADAQIVAAERRLQAMDRESSEALARLAFALSALDGNVAALADRLAAGAGHAEIFDAKAERVRSLLETIQRQAGEAIPQALADLDEKAASSQQGIGNLRHGVAEVDSEMIRLGSVLGNFESRIAMQSGEIARLAESSESSWQASAEEIGTLIAAMRAAREEVDQINDHSAIRLTETMRDIQREAHAAADEARRAMDHAIIGATDKLGEDSAAALEKVLRGKAEELVGKLESAINRAVGATSEASLHLKDQLSRVDDLATHLERRVAEAREQAEERTDNEFARRLALLTESLHSAAIDVDKILSSEVSDTAWSAYLRGDRGVFTRRAVRLIDNGEARDIAQTYENDPEFFELVNRYIHDFETMLRTVLSTRDGGVMGVTLLSSETGKLYVALAQAIERLRN